MAIDFEMGSSQYVALGANLSSLQNVTGATICAWVVWESAGALEQYLISFSNNLLTTTNRAGLSRNLGGTSLARAAARRLDADAVSAVLSPGAVADGVLTHFAGVMLFNGGTLNLYLNGALSATLAVAGWVGATSNTVSLSANLGALANATLFADGVIDDFRVYDRGLSASEVNTIFQARSKDGIALNLVHRWKTVEAAPGVAVGNVVDIGPGARAGTGTNAPIYANCLIGTRRRRAA